MAQFNFLHTPSKIDIFILRLPIEYFYFALLDPRDFFPIYVYFTYTVVLLQKSYTQQSWLAKTQLKNRKIMIILLFHKIPNIPQI